MSSMPCDSKAFCCAPAYVFVATFASRGPRVARRHTPEVAQWSFRNEGWVCSRDKNTDSCQAYPCIPGRGQGVRVVPVLVAGGLRRWRRSLSGSGPCAPMLGSNSERLASDFGTLPGGPPGRPPNRRSSGPQKPFPQARSRVMAARGRPPATPDPYSSADYARTKSTPTSHTESRRALLIRCLIDARRLPCGGETVFVLWINQVGRVRQFKTPVLPTRLFSLDGIRSFHELRVSECHVFWFRSCASSGRQCTNLTRLRS